MSVTIATSKPLANPALHGNASSPQPAGDGLAASVKPDAGVAASNTLRAAANVLATVPPELLRMGTTRFSAKTGPFGAIHLGEAVVNRTASEIDIDVTGIKNVHLAITADPKDPSIADVTLPGQAPIAGQLVKEGNGGFEAKTTDGKTVTLEPAGNNINVSTNISGVPKITLVRES